MLITSPVAFIWVPSRLTGGLSPEDQRQLDRLQATTTELVSYNFV